MRAITMRDVDELRFHTMPQDQGQIVEISYAAPWEFGPNGILVCHSLDRSDREESYSWAEIANNEADDWEFEPQNGVLPTTTGAWHTIPKGVSDEV